MANVTLKQVQKVYPGGTEAVKDFNLEIPSGEFLVLVGPSGCGKTTTLRMIAGLEEITHGEIAIDNRVINLVAPKDRDIAMVFQNYALYPHMSVFENMAFGLKLRKTPREEITERVHAAATLLGIGELLDRRPRQLSGGQRQRVAVGRAIVRQPKVFLFDEPLSNLDAKLRVSTRKELNQLHKRLGVTMIYVTHDQIEAMTLGDRIVVMSQGVIQQVGPPIEVYDTPLICFVARFIGMPPMNLFQGRLEADGDQVVWADAARRVPILQEEFAARLRPHLGREAFLGIRPEDILNRAYHPEARGQGNLSATVSLIEPLGDECLIYLEIPGIQVYRAGDDVVEPVMRVPSHQRVEKGSRLELALLPERVHIFDAQTKRNLNADPAILDRQPPGSAPAQAAAAIPAAAASA